MKNKIRLKFLILPCSAALISISAFKIFNGPVITPAKPVYDFDTILQGTTFKGKIPFQNTGNGTLFIMYATANDAALLPHWNTNPVMPGKWDTISFDFLAGKKTGRQNPEITIVGNCENQQSILKITGVVADTAKKKAEAKVDTNSDFPKAKTKSKRYPN